MSAPPNHPKHRDPRRSLRLAGPALAVATLAAIGVAVGAVLSAPSLLADGGTPAERVDDVRIAAGHAAPRPVPVLTQPLPDPTEQAARRVLAAWLADEPATMAAHAEPPVLEVLFARPAPPTATFAGCRGAAGSSVCVVELPSDRLLLRVRNDTGGLPVVVTDAHFGDAL